jgi:excisionase family DNA binding protein
MCPENIVCIDIEVQDIMKARTYRTVTEISRDENAKLPTIYQWVRRRKLRAYRVGSQIRITNEAWEEFVLQCNK